MTDFEDDYDIQPPEITAGGSSGSRQQPQVPPPLQDFRPEVVDALIASATNRHRWDYLPQQVWDRCNIATAFDRVFDQNRPLKKLKFVPLPPDVPAVTPAQTLLGQQSQGIFRAVVSRVKAIPWPAAK